MLQALGDGLFHLICLRLILLQAYEPCLPLHQFRIGQDDILDDGIALVFVLKFGCMPFRFRRAEELLLRGVENRTLRDGIRQCRCASFDAQRVIIGITEPGADIDLRDVGAVEFAVRGESTLHIGIGDCRGGAMREREPNGAFQRQWFGVAERFGQQYGRENRRKECQQFHKARTPR